MADPAALGAAMLAALREHTASNDSTAPQWRRIEAEAVARGFPSTRAFRAWCFARGVEVRETTLRDAVRATLPTEHRYDASVYRTPLTMKTVKPMADRVDRLRHDLDAPGTPTRAELAAR